MSTSSPIAPALDVARSQRLERCRSGTVSTASSFCAGVARAYVDQRHPLAARQPTIPGVVSAVRQGHGGYAMHSNGNPRSTGLLVNPAQADLQGSNGKIAFASDRDGNFEIYVMNADGSSQTRLTSNAADNCTLKANPTQLDANGDGYGNLCNADFNHSGLVTTADFGILRARLNEAPGPSGLACAGTIPCP